MTLKSDANFEEKLNFCLKNGVRDLMSILTQSEDGVSIFCLKYVIFELKKYRRVVSREK